MKNGTQRASSSPQSGGSRNLRAARTEARCLGVPAYCRCAACRHDRRAARLAQDVGQFDATAGAPGGDYFSIEVAR